AASDEGVRGQGSGVREEEATWRVTYLLQARDDPSLFIPLKEAWKPRGQVARVFEARGFEPGEYLLTALGQAAALCPVIEQSLKRATPGYFETDTAGAHDFLPRSAWLIEQAGCTVLLPSWWTGRGTRARLTVQADVGGPTLQAGGGLDVGALLRFDWKVAIGGEMLSLEELQALARLKSPLVKMRGQWV